MSASCKPRVQSFVNAGSGWLHSALRYHQLMPISCHFRDCQSASGHEFASCKKRYSKYLTLLLPLYTIYVLLTYILTHIRPKLRLILLFIKGCTLQSMSHQFDNDFATKNLISANIRLLECFRLRHFYCSATRPTYSITIILQSFVVEPP